MLKGLANFPVSQEICSRSVSDSVSCSGSKNDQNMTSLYLCTDIGGQGAIYKHDTVVMTWYCMQD